MFWRVAGGLRILRSGRLGAGDFGTQRVGPSFNTYVPEIHHSQDLYHPVGLLVNNELRVGVDVCSY